MIHTRECVIVPDPRRDPRYIIGRRRTRSEIAVPIALGNQTIGALNLESDRASAFGEENLGVLRFFADAAAISIERAMLHAGSWTSDGSKTSSASRRASSRACSRTHPLEWRVTTSPGSASPPSRSAVITSTTSASPTALSPW